MSLLVKASKGFRLDQQRLIFVEKSRNKVHAVILPENVLVRALYSILINENLGEI